MFMWSPQQDKITLAATAGRQNKYNRQNEY
jgi:hypothetical protein